MDSWSRRLSPPLEWFTRLFHFRFLPSAEEADPEPPLLDSDVHALPVLVDLLKDRNAVTRRIAAIALGRLGSQARSAVPALLLATADKEYSVRLDAEDAIFNIDAETARSARLGRERWQQPVIPFSEPSSGSR